MKSPPFFWKKLAEISFSALGFWISQYLMQLRVGHTAWAPEGREGRSPAGPKDPQQEVGPNGPLYF